jgi:hypothetical protein
MLLLITIGNFETNKALLGATSSGKWTGYMHYNFARVYQTLRVTPAMESGIANHVWTLDEIVGLINLQP